ncbi:MAG: NlpC/P60 family protein [Bacteroidia bacterium]|nr:NlpC/P60 family protein [Bacteroidia bacterium]
MEPPSETQSGSKRFLVVCMILVSGLLSAFTYPHEDVPPSRKIESIIQTAQSYLGVPYQLGGIGREGIDCSGLMVVSFAAADISLPRTSRTQVTEGLKIDRSQLRPGDLVFFKRGKQIRHVGMVVAVLDGDVQFIHASYSRGVMISSLSESYWSYRYYGARRIVEGPLDTYSFLLPSPVIEPVVAAPAPPPVPGAFPEGSAELLSDAELESMTPRARRLMAYEICARHGYVFSEPKIQAYFEAQPWYAHTTRVQSVEQLRARLSSVEWTNLQKLRSLE